MIRTPASILYDVNGIPTAVSASDQPTSGALGHVLAGFDATNTVRYAAFEGDSLKVTAGTFSIVGADTFANTIVGSRYNQLEIAYDQTDPDSITAITVTKTGGGDAINSGGQAVFSTSTGATGGIKAVTNASVAYRPQAEVYAAFTCIFTLGVANSYQRIGIYDANNGFFIGYEGTSFGVTIRKAGSDTTTARASFNLDTLLGAADSKYTRNGVPEALDPEKDNLYRIRFGWLGAAPIVFETLSPDGAWVPFHIIRHPNTNAATSINNPDLPITLDAQKTSGATNITMSTACWAAGTTSDLAPLNATLTSTSLAKLTRSVLTGETTAGGGGFVNVKVNPSGALTVEIDDGGGSITVDGSVTVLGDNAVALQQDAANKLIVIDTDVSGAINDTRLTLSGSLADFSARNRTDLLLVSGAIESSRISLSGSIDDARLTLSSSLREFKDANHADLLAVSGTITSAETVLSGALAQIYTELNSGDVDIRALTFSTDSVTAYQGGIFSVTGSGDVGLLRQDPSTRDLYVTGTVLVASGNISITDNVNGIANIETIGNRKALAVEYPLLLDVMGQVLVELKRIRKHMESITEEEWSENDDI